MAYGKKAEKPKLGPREQQLREMREQRASKSGAIKVRSKAKATRRSSGRGR